ncbi:MAG: hypothetical protein KJ072_25950 [Verrucomicrobia bacterium]|nr:hypothetical protein [Verrucomicrobiota bacterium]
MRIVKGLLDGAGHVPAQRLLEAAIRLPPRGRRWIAVYTGVAPGKQVWRSTGETERDAAMAKALAWEKEARTRRAALGLKPREPSIRVQRSRRSAFGTVAPGLGPLSQREVAMILRISERAVRNIERRALEKLRRHPMLGELWAELSLGGTAQESRVQQGPGAELTPTEIAALVALARNEEELLALNKLLSWIGSTGI